MDIRPLHDVGHADLAVAGGKGANLGELLRLGLPVPPGFVITTAALTGHEGPLAPDLAAAILQAYHDLGGGPVAVRSSATAEDLADASFAGQQETFLNVSGDAALLEAVQRCRDSLWSPRAVHYRQQRGIDEESVAMAVVVQRMVHAEAAGVLFTVDPVSGRADRLVIEAAKGLGEAVVSGDVTGDSYRIDRSGTLAVVERQVREPGRPVLTDDRALELAGLGLRLEAHFGLPQDIEFAVADGRVWLLQSRPITTHVSAEPEPLPPEEAPDLMQKVMLPLGKERYPIAPRPLDHLYFAMMIEANSRVLARNGFRFAPEAVAELKARLWHTQYISFPRSRPTLKALNNYARMMRNLARDWTGWWTNTAGPRLVAVSQPLDWTSLTDQELLARSEAIMADWQEIFTERMGFSDAIFAETWLKVLLTPFFGSRRAGALVGHLTTGVRTRTTETNEALWLLSRGARANPRVCGAVARGDHAALSTFDAGQAFLADVQAFLATHGHREGATWYLSTPTWGQAPDQVWQILQGQVAVDAPPAVQTGRPEAAAAAVRSRLALLPPLARYVLRLAARLRQLQAFREDSHFDLTRPLAAMQAIAREWGRRLVERGLLGRWDDVFYLTHAEVKAWLGGSGPDRAGAMAHIARRRATYTLVAARWQERMSPPHRQGPDLRGVPASAGVVRAKARIVRSEVDWHTLRPGEVLVCPYTNPAWTPLFAAAAAVITETGGAGAHAAIVAREYGIPAVMGVAGATERIADGQEVLVDGSSGRVSLLAPAQAGAPASAQS